MLDEAESDTGEHNNLVQEAITFLKSAEELEPNSPVIHGYLATAHKQAIDFDHNPNADACASTAFLSKWVGEHDSYPSREPPCTNCVRTGISLLIDRFFVRH